MRKYLLYATFVLVSFGCVNMHTIDQIELISTEILCKNCQSPNLHLQKNSELLISYIKSENDSLDQLLLHEYADGHITPSSTLVEGQNWFVNWADIPSVVSLDDEGNTLFAHWLQMSAEGTYDYDIHCGIKLDTKQKIEESFILHSDSVKAEHGFVTMISDENGAFVTWLDGRNTKTQLPDPKIVKNMDHEHDGHTHDHNGTMPMTLRSAWIDVNGKKYKDFEIDNRVCDCCQTDAAMTNSGPIVVYRDRSEDEIRDIKIAKYKNGNWINKKVYNDNWKIAGCPVNGPATAYKNGLLAVVWYTEMNGVPKIYLSTSMDEGDTFAEPILIEGEGALGRVDVSISKEGYIIVTWVSLEDEIANIKASIIRDGVSLLEGISLMETSPSRSSGFPIIEIVGEEIIMVRTIDDEDQLHIELSKMKIL